MSSEIPFGEAWLLETAVRWNTPMRFLTYSRERMRSQFNNDGHGLCRADLCETLGRLFIEGTIIARTHDEMGEVATEFVPKAATIPQILDAPDLRICYGLTASGGARWERFAIPKWERYFVDEWQEPDTVLLTGGSPDQLRQVLANAKWLWMHDPIVETIQWDEFSPWEVTAWKTLPIGFRATYRFHKRYGAERLDGFDIAIVRELRGWANSICGYRWV